MNASQKLIDAYLPRYSFREYHETVVNRSMATVYAAAKDFDLSKSRLIKFLFTLRGLPTRRMHLQGLLADMGFTCMEENIPEENLIGFWGKYTIEPIPSTEAFISDSIAPRIKVVWNFYLEALAANQVRLSTETRILCLTPAATVLFGLYWMLIRPFSGLIRKKMLQIIKQDSETAAEP